jgi:hypothetical protein
VSVKYGVIDIIDGDFTFLNCGGDADVPSSIWRLGKGKILGIHGGKRGGRGTASPYGLTERNGGGGLQVGACKRSR